MDFLIYNGEIKSKEEDNLSHLLYNGTFSLNHKIWYGYGGIPLFDENIRLIGRQAEALNLPLPQLFQNKRELFRITKRMLNKNKFYRSGYVHCHIYRGNQNSELLITSNAFHDFEFPFSEEGKLITISPQKKHSENNFNPFGFFNEMLWETTLSQLRGLHFQNAVLTNEKGAVCECAFSNIFLIKRNELITPSKKTGCFIDVLRPYILETARLLKLKTVESASIQPADLKNMDEIFLASEQAGIQWVLGVENKRFLHRHSRQIHDKLNEFLKAKPGH